MRRITELASDNRGGTVIEYGMILGVIVIVMFVSLQLVANKTIGMFNHVQNEVSNATGNVS